MREDAWLSSEVRDAPDGAEAATVLEIVDPSKRYDDQVAQLGEVPARSEEADALAPASWCR